LPRRTPPGADTIAAQRTKRRLEVMSRSNSSREEECPPRSCRSIVPVGCRNLGELVRQPLRKMKKM
jgi:hypothetical protein